MSVNKPRILIVDDEPNMRESLQEILSDSGFLCSIAENGEQALNVLKQNEFELVISDVKMPRMQGIDLLKHVKKSHPSSSLLLITAFATVQQAVEAIKAGAEDYITKPFDPDDLIKIINRILHRTQADEEQVESSEREIIGSNIKMKEIYEVIQTVAPTNCTVLIEGESGTGKELIADALHHQSNRKDEPFIKVNCAAIPTALMESELFGHVKGSFTGAIKDKKGKFELADGGTIYLDEIGDMETSLQAKILRVLQEKEFTQVGSESTKQVDVRVIAATNKDLQNAIGTGEFREDLFYRLNVINIKLPPLRERKDDLPLLINHFIEKFNSVLNQSIKGVSQDALKILLQYEWPGNIRELENALERAMIMSHSEFIEVENLPEHITHTREESVSEDSSFQHAKQQFEKSLLEDALTRCNGSITQAANMLGISRHAFRYQMGKYEIKK